MGPEGPGTEHFCEFGYYLRGFKLYKTENCTKEKNIGCLRGGVHGEGGKGEGKALFLNYTKQNNIGFVGGVTGGGGGGGSKRTKQLEGPTGFPGARPQQRGRRIAIIIIMVSIYSPLTTYLFRVPDYGFGIRPLTTYLFWGSLLLWFLYIAL